LFLGDENMLDIIKKQFNKILQAFIYTLLLCLIYGIWSYKAWNLWYVTLIIVLVIIGLGFVVSYLWIKSEVKKESTVENNN
jgi:ABC-type polysaccharide/polyol phosphate export permease